MTAADWTRDEDYTWLEALDASGLAWEFLRRNPDYGEAFRSGRDVGSFGLCFPVDPALSAREADPLWRWEMGPAVSVLFAPAPASGATRARLERAAVFRRGAEEGLHLRFPGGWQALLPPLGEAAQPLGAVLPFGRELVTRILSARAVAGGLAGRWSAAGRLSRPRRARLARAVRALDAHAAGASYREIAGDVLGEAFAASQLWRTSSARAVAIRLRAVGLSLVRGGYARLLGGSAV
jgi:hypothetical protein